MKVLHKIILPGLFLAILVLALASPVSAAGLPDSSTDGKVVLGGNYTLPSGETLAGDLAVLGGNSTIEEGATVQGSVFMAGGNLSIGGEIRGDVVILGGNITLEETSLVTGGVNSIGGSMSRAAGAQIQGEVITSERPLDLALPHSLMTPRYSFNFDPLMKLVTWLFQALALAALAMIVAMLAPKASSRTAAAAINQAVAAGGIGLLTAVLAPFILLLMVITLIGIPVAIVALMALVVAVVFGWIVLGLELGQRLARAFNTTWSAPLAAGLGTLVLSLVANGVGFIPCVGWLAPFLVSILGLGAVILTRFGVRDYPESTAMVPAPAYRPAPPWNEPPVPPSTPIPPAPQESPAPENNM